MIGSVLLRSGSRWATQMPTWLPHGLVSRFVTKTTVTPSLFTTPIFYVNGKPHIGHVYTSVLTDVLSKWEGNKQPGRSSILVSGTDEHGVKVVQAATKAGASPQDLADTNSDNFKAALALAGVSPDVFVRTSSTEHFKAVQALWTCLQDRGGFYQDTYEGWYCVSDEAYVSGDDVDHETGGDGPPVSKLSGHPLEWISETNWHFRLSQYQDQLIDYISSDRLEICPPERKAEILSWLRSGPLRDLSVSRPSSRISWGVPVPGDPDQTVYVWLDALTNYLTAAGYPDETYKTLWPPHTQVIGKDILRFHAVYWPAFLLAADLPLPKKLLVHSHWTVGRRKMSKSIGNVVDPCPLIEAIGPDVIRYFLARDGGLVDDGDWSLPTLVSRVNNELVNDLGNLLSRTTGIKVLPDRISPPSPLDDPNAGSTFTPEEREFIDSRLNQAWRDVDQAWSVKGSLGSGLGVLSALWAKSNQLWSHAEPWVLASRISKSDDQEEIDRLQARLNDVVLLGHETIRISGCLLWPIAPSAATCLYESLGIQGHSPVPHEHVCTFGALPGRRRLPPASPLLPRLCLDDLDCEPGGN